jgi:hypothetical protein
MGIANVIDCLGSVPNAPPAIIATTREVVEEELCISDVASIPINKPIKGLLVVSIKVLEKPLPNIFIPSPIICRLRKNKYKKKTSLITEKRFDSKNEFTGLFLMQFLVLYILYLFQI